MSWPRIGALALLSLTLPPNRDPPREEPIDRGAVRPAGPPGEAWVHRVALVSGLRVRLNGLGARTHANWVLFRLPFHADQSKRVRSVRFTPSSAARSDVGALRIGSVCVPAPSDHGVEHWAIYTTSGIGRTEQYRWHPAAPTDDPTVAGINVPTRVANYVACGRDEGKLDEPSNWTLTVEWDER